MFDIKIGTLIPAESALTMIPQLNAVGFESYELNFNDCCALANGSEGVLKEYGKRVLDVRSRILSQMQSISIVTE